MALLDNVHRVTVSRYRNAQRELIAEKLSGLRHMRLEEGPVREALLELATYFYTTTRPAFLEKLYATHPQLPRPPEDVNTMAEVTEWLDEELTSPQLTLIPERRRAGD